MNVFSCCSHLEFALQGVPFCERVRHLVPDELREVWQEHRVCAILPSAGRIPGNPRHSLECRQFWSGAGKVIFYN